MVESHPISMIIPAQMLRICRTAKPVPTFGDRALKRDLGQFAFRNRAQNFIRMKILAKLHWLIGTAQNFDP